MALPGQTAQGHPLRGVPDRNPAVVHHGRMRPVGTVFDLFGAATTGLAALAVDRYIAFT
jgi:hypothetical protein